MSVNLILFSGVGVGNVNDAKFITHTSVYKRFLHHLDDIQSKYKDYLVPIVNQLALYEALPSPYPGGEVSSFMTVYQPTKYI